MDWEKRFDEYFSCHHFSSVCTGHCRDGKVILKSFVQSEITAAEQRGRNKVLDEIEKEIEELLAPELGYKDRPFFGTSAAIKFARVTNQTISEVRSIIQRYKV